MARYVSAVVVPGTCMSAALGFTPEKMNLCERLLPKLAAELRGRGVEFTDAITDQGYGLATHLLMPGDLKVQLYQPRCEKGSG